MKIKVDNLVKIFGRNPERGLSMLEQGIGKEEILNKHKLTVGVAGVSFAVDQGEIFVVMGLSGSGKSTLIRCLNRLHEPTGGTIEIDGNDVTTMTMPEMRALRREKMGMVFQNFALYPNRTILDNVAFGLEVRGISRDERHKKAQETIEAVGLKGYEQQYPAQLSGGMQQRVGLARALASDPDILLMDEPFSALDPLIRKDMQDELLKLQGQMNKTIIFITHDLDEALSLGDRIAIMKDGVVVQVGTAEEILNKPEDDYVVKFTENVDRSRILTAEYVMQKPLATARLGRDGVNTVLRKMERHGLSTILAVDSADKLVGGFLPDDIGKAQKEQLKLEDVVTKDVPTTHPETTLHDLLETSSDATFPLAVVDDNGVLKGIIVRSFIIAALTRRGEV